MSVRIFVEGQFDKVLLDRLLADLGESYSIVAGGGRDATRPLARKHLLIREEPVALVLDADTREDQKVQAQQQALEDYFQQGGSVAPFKVFQFVPEIEVLFFEHPNLLEGFLGKKLEPQSRVAGRFAPHDVLESLVGNELDFVSKLSDEDLIELRNSGAISKLRDFVRKPTRGNGNGQAAH